MIDVTVKIIGASLPMVASLVYGRMKIRELRRNLSTLSAFHRLVVFIGDNVEHFMKPIPEIVESFSEPYLEEIGFLKKARTDGLLSAWKSTDTGFSKEAESLLDTYFSSVGKGYLEDEKKLSDYTEKRLSDILDAEKLSSADRERIYKTVPPMLAGSVILILI